MESFSISENINRSIVPFEINLLEALEIAFETNKRRYGGEKSLDMRLFCGMDIAQIREFIKKKFASVAVADSSPLLVPDIVGVLPNIPSYISGLPDSMLFQQFTDIQENAKNLDIYISVPAAIDIDDIEKQFIKLRELFLSDLSQKSRVNFTLHYHFHIPFYNDRKFYFRNVINRNSYHVKLIVSRSDSFPTNEVLNLLGSSLIFRFIALATTNAVFLKSEPTTAKRSLNCFPIHFEVSKKYLPLGTIDLMSL